VQQTTIRPNRNDHSDEGRQANNEGGFELIEKGKEKVTMDSYWVVMGGRGRDQALKFLDGRYKTKTLEFLGQ
jgi:hypothetical protein